MKVLLSAFSCGPGRGSEPGVGWNWVQQISKEHEVWLLTTDESQADIAREALPRVHPTFIPSFKRWDWLQRQIIPGLDWIYYYWWQWKAYRVALELHRKVQFDIAHHVTFVSWRGPSFISKLPIPFIWGPVGGGGVPPKSLAGELGLKGRLYEGFRAFCQHVPRFDPGVRLTMGRASLILTNVQETADLIPSKFKPKVQLMFGVGAPEIGPVSTGEKSSSDFLVLFAAQLRPIKGGTLALRAFAQLVQKHPRSRLVILGEGFEETRLKALASSLGIAAKIDWLGWRPRAEVFQWMQKCDVLLHPSLRDSGGMVLLEAMAQAKPVICIDLGGPGHIVTPDCGFKIPPSEPATVADALGQALLQLAEDETKRRNMGTAARMRVRGTFDWNNRGSAMLKLYKQVTRQTSCDAI